MKAQGITEIKENLKTIHSVVVVVSATYFVTLDADDLSGLVQCLILVGVRSNPDLIKKRILFAIGSFKYQ